MSYPVTGVLYDTNGTTPIPNVAVVITEVTNNQSATVLTNGSGAFSYDLATFPNDYSIGDIINIFSSYKNYFASLFFTVSSAGSYNTGTSFYLQNLIQTPFLYCSIKEVRDYTGIPSTEFTDQAVYDMILRVSSWIDEETGRTWKGIQTVTDEYYDGDDTDLLWLNNIDIVTVTAVSIDENLSGTFTPITSPSTNIHVYQEGYIILDRSANITSFIAGPRNIKVSYTYGNAQPTETIRYLSILMIANLMHVDPVRTEQIDRIFHRERWIGPRGLY